MSTKTKPTEDLESALRRAVRECGLTRYAIAKGSGLDYAQLNRFEAEKRSLTLPAASLLATFLGLELRPKRKR